MCLFLEDSTPKAWSERRGISSQTGCSMGREAASPEGHTSCPPAGDARILLPLCLCSGLSPGQDEHIPRPPGVMNDRGLAATSLAHPRGSSRIDQLPVTSAPSPAGYRHQAQQPALSVELGLVSESAQVLCLLQTSPKAAISEIFSLVSGCQGGICLRSLRQRHKPRVSFPNVTTSISKT